METKKVIAHFLMTDFLESEELYRYFEKHNHDIFEYISLPIENELLSILSTIKNKLLFVFLSDTMEIEEKLDF